VNTDSNTQWGNAVAQDPTYTYVYGDYTRLHGGSSAGSFVGMKLARVLRGHSLNLADWQYWDGSSWISGETQAAPVFTTDELTGVTAQPSGSGYMAVSIPRGVGRDKTVDVSYACAPEGPWSTPNPVYSIPEITRYSHEIAYIPTFHPELSGQSGLVVSYNVDTTDGLTAVRHNVRAYQPRFLNLGGLPLARGGI
jgi:hypothetical protein